jgi:hypothetical protein
MRIKNALKEQLPVKLSTLGFLYGSIKPDISPAFNNIPHYKKDSEDFVRSEIMRLLETGYPIYSECSTDFSKSLGVITHYLSDFFCYAHSEEYKGGLWKHSIYEMRISAHWRLTFRKFLFLPNDCTLPSKQSYAAISDFIDELHCEYSEKNPSPVDDITYAQEVCFALCHSVLTACLAENQSAVKLEEVFV